MMTLVFAMLVLLMLLVVMTMAVLLVLFVIITVSPAFIRIRVGT